MTINQITAGTLPGAAATGGRFFLSGALEFAASLKLGQVLKARVLRHYEGSRYLADFGGNERVVDSAIPLNTGEVLYGRVIGLGDKVELQRVQDVSVSGETPVSSPATVAPTAGGALGAMLESISSDYRVTFSESDRAVLMTAARKADQPELMMQAGAYLNKLALSQNADLLEAIYARLNRDGERTMRSLLQGSAPELSVVEQESGAAVSAATLKQMSSILEQAVDQNESEHSRDESTETGGRDSASAPLQEAAVQALQRQQADADGSRDELMERMAQWLLNAQGGGSVSHRLGTIPFLMDGRLVEVDLALFEQRQSPQINGTTTHRKIVLALNTENLGKVNVEATVSGENLRLRVVADNREHSDAVADHAQHLRRSLTQLGWTVDEIRYETTTAGAPGNPARSVLNHMIGLDSFNRLV